MQTFLKNRNYSNPLNFKDAINKVLRDSASDRASLVNHSKRNLGIRPEYLFCIP